MLGSSGQVLSSSGQVPENISASQTNAHKLEEIKDMLKNIALENVILYPQVAKRICAFIDSKITLETVYALIYEN